jgi:hypothetical protein
LIRPRIVQVGHHTIVELELCFCQVAPADRLTLQLPTKTCVSDNITIVSMIGVSPFEQPAHALLLMDIPTK